MHNPDDEDSLLREVALQNAQSIFRARRRAEEELSRAKEALERKSQELAESLAMMRATLESTTDAILATNDRREITCFNRNYLELWSLPPSALESNSHPALLQTLSRRFDAPSAFLARMHAIESSRDPESFDVLRLSDGRSLELSSRAQMVNGETVGRVWSLRDITEQQRAVDGLKDEARILSLLNAAGTTLAAELNVHALAQSVTDAATELSDAEIGAFFYHVANDAGEVETRYALSGSSLDAFDQLGLPGATSLPGRTFRGQDVIRCEDVTQDPRYGSAAPHFGIPEHHPPVRSYLAVPVISRVGEAIGGLIFGHAQRGVFTERTQRIVAGIAGYAAIAMDNAQLFENAQRNANERQELLASEQAARAEAERASSIKDEFLATLSHELRTPLNAILGWAHVLKTRMRDSDAPDIQRGFEAIERNTRAQTQLVEDLIDMSRITSGKLRLDIQSVNPVNFIQAAIETVSAAAEAKGIQLTVVLDPGAGPITGDPNRLQQVVWNLLSNAIKFTSKGGKVQVLLERVSSHIEISVADSGIGIDSHLIAHVFERFRQADSSSTRTYGGLGLGLSIVKQLVELHGGTVVVSSRGSSQGTTFTVCLPLTIVQRSTNRDPRIHPTAHGALSLPHEACNLVGVKVLVVDDHDDARELVERVLIDCGAEVLTAGTALHALELVERERPDVLVSDLGMPEIDGFELLKRVRALGAASGGRIPAIALTALARSEDRTRALRAGFMVHVAKPVEPAELVATVASAAGRTGI